MGIFKYKFQPDMPMLTQCGGCNHVFEDNEIVMEWDHCCNKFSCWNCRCDQTNQLANVFTWRVADAGKREDITEEITFQVQACVVCKDPTCSKVAFLGEYGLLKSTVADISKRTLDPKYLFQLIVKKGKVPTVLDYAASDNSWSYFLDVNLGRTPPQRQPFVPPPTKKFKRDEEDGNDGSGRRGRNAYNLRSSH